MSHIIRANLKRISSSETYADRHRHLGTISQLDKSCEPDLRIIYQYGSSIELLIIKDNAATSKFGMKYNRSLLDEEIRPRFFFLPITGCFSDKYYKYAWLFLVFSKSVF